MSHVTVIWRTVVNHLRRNLSLEGKKMYYWYAHGEQRPVRSGGTAWWQMHSSVSPSWRAIRAQDYIKCNWISHYDYTHRWKWCIRIMLCLLSYLVLISLKFAQKETTSLTFYTFLGMWYILNEWIRPSTIYNAKYCLVVTRNNFITFIIVYLFCLEIETVSMNF